MQDYFMITKHYRTALILQNNVVSAMATLKQTLLFQTVDKDLSKLLVPYSFDVTDFSTVNGRVKNKHFPININLF